MPTKSLAWLSSLLLSLVMSNTHAVELDRVIAIVNDDIILSSELTQRELNIRSQAKARQTPLPAAPLLREQIIERLIIESLQFQLAKQQGIIISDLQLNEAIENIARHNNISLLELRDSIQQQGQDFEDFRNQIRDDLTLRQVQRSNVQRRVTVSEQEIDTFLESPEAQALNKERALLSNILISIPNQASSVQINEARQKANAVLTRLRNGADFAQEAARNSSARNALQGGDLGWRDLQVLPAPLARATRGLKIGEVSNLIRTPSGFYILKLRDREGIDNQSFEELKVRHILIKPSQIVSDRLARTKIEDIYRQLENNANFETLARSQSDDRVSGSQGGDLGWVLPGQMVPEFEAVMLRTPVGELSAPFQSRFGWHILQVVNKRNKDIGADLMVNKARAAIQERKYNEELESWLRELRASAYVQLK